MDTLKTQTEHLAAYLELGGLSVTLDKEKGQGTARSTSGVTVTFSESTNDPALWLEIHVPRTKTDADSAAALVSQVVIALRGIR